MNLRKENEYLIKQLDAFRKEVSIKPRAVSHSGSREAISPYRTAIVSAVAANNYEPMH